MNLLGYKSEILFFRIDNAYNKYSARNIIEGLYDITSYYWELTNTDTGSTVYTSISEVFNFQFTQVGNYAIKSIVTDSFIGIVETSQDIQILNINSNFYVVKINITIDGNVASRGGEGLYFSKGSTPSLIFEIKNYNYETKEYSPLDLTDLNIYLRIKTSEEYKEDIPDYDCTYLVEYNSVDNSDVVSKLEPPTGGVLKVDLSSQDTDIIGKLTIQLKLVSLDGTIVKTNIEEIESLDSV